MKYIIDVPETPMFATACYSRNGSPIATNITEFEPYTEPDRQAVEDEVWDLAKACCDIMDYEWQLDTYQQAKGKIEAWKKQEDEIRVGDEVYSKTSKWRGIVTDIDDGDLTILDGSGQTACHHNPKHFGKTGKHFDSIKNLLEGLKEN